jgi:peptide/nickel transport system permease protein
MPGGKTLSSEETALEMQPIVLPSRRSHAGESPLATAARSLLHHRSGMVGLVITLALLVMALVAPLFAPYDPLEMHPDNALDGPSLSYPMGTDEFGRDILSRILLGSRISLAVGFVSIALAVVVGASMGLVAGYVGHTVENVIMRVCDILLAFPAILLAIVILAILGPSGPNAMLAVGIVNVPAFARLTRANVLGEKHKEYVTADRALGARTGRIIFMTILPNTMATLLVQITIAIAGAVLLESSLSFLGLGTPLPAPSWGSMLTSGKGYLYNAPWYGIFPGLAITLLVMGLYLLGDGLRDALDPRRQKITLS